MDSKKNCNIFCAITPFHYFLLRQCFVNKFGKADKNILITNFNIDDIDERFKAVNCIHYTMPGQYGWELYIRNKYRKRLNFVVDNVIRASKEYDGINLFAAVLINPISNGIYSSLKNHKGFKYINFPDGIGSVTTTKRTLKDFIKLYTKILLSKIRLLKYCYFGALEDSQGTYCADVIYSFLPEFIKNKTKAKIEKIDLYGEMTQSEDILFLGQPGVETIIEEALYFLKNNYSLTRIYYKPHHRENKEFFEKMYQKYNFNIVSTNKCIEEYFVTERSFKIVIACTSSALINLKMMFRDKVRCISYKGTNAIEPCRREELIELYKRFGVEIINEE